MWNNYLRVEFPFELHDGDDLPTVEWTMIDIDTCANLRYDPVTIGMEKPRSARNAYYMQFST